MQQPQVALDGRMLVYGALASHHQTDPSACKLPLFAPRLIFSATTVEGRFLFHWFTAHPLNEGATGLRGVLNRLASGTLHLPPARRYPFENIKEAMREAESATRAGKPLRTSLRHRQAWSNYFR